MNQTHTPQTATAPPPASAQTAIADHIPDPPGDLTLDELAEWMELAPRAHERGTLTDKEKFALRDLCRLRVLQNRLMRQLSDLGDIVPGAGGQLAANPLLARITTLSQRIDAGMMRFMLAPMGKEIPKAEAPTADPWAEFDDAVAAPAKGTH